MRKSFLLGAAVCCYAGIVCASHGQSLAPAKSTSKSPWRWLGPLAPKPDLMPPVPTLPVSPAHIWTMDEALARALDANPDVQVALAGVQHQEGVRLQSVALLLPRIGVSASVDWRDHSLIDFSPQDLTQPPSSRTSVAQRSFNSRVEMREMVFDGFASWAQVKRAVLLKKKAAVDARDAYLKIASQVREAYDAILVRQSMLSARRQAAHDMAHLAEVARKRFEAGEISEFESLRAESAQRSSEADLAEAEADLVRSEGAFCSMLYIARPAGGLQLAGQVEPVKFNETFDAALARAKSERLDVRSAALNLAAADLGVQATARSSLLPRVDAYVNYGNQSSYYDENRVLDGWSVGVSGDWTIFDSGQTSGAIRAQRADRRVAEIRLAEAQRVVGSEVHELFAGLDQAKTVMQAQATARDLAGRSVQEARKLYEVGRVSLEEILNAEIAYRQTLLGWLSAVYSYNATVYQIDYATGNDAFLDKITKQP